MLEVMPITEISIPVQTTADHSITFQTSRSPLICPQIVTWFDTFGEFPLPLITVIIN